MRTLTAPQFLPAAVLLLTSGLLMSCSQAPEESEEGPLLRPVRTVIAENAVAGPYKEFTAVVDASKKVDLAFKVSGRVIELPVKSGDEVVEGQLVARLDDTDFKIQRDEAQSSYDKALSDFNRARNLITSNSISQADFDQLKAQYNSASAQLENASNKLDYTRLYASFDGVIAQRHVENFQEINAQAPIVALHDLHNINFNVDVPESVLINIRPDDVPPKVQASFVSIPDQTFDLTFKEISTQADEVTKTYQVTFTMPSPQTHNILPGMSARVRVFRTESEDLAANFYLPAHTVLKDEQGNYVFGVKQGEAGVGTITKHYITIGDLTPWGVEVFSGIEAGQHVLSAGMSKVSEGMAVRFQG